MSKTQKISPNRFASYLSQRIGQKIYLNADDCHPCTLEDVYEDYMMLTTSTTQSQPAGTFIIPFNSIVSMQEIEGVGGLVVYLVR